MSLKAGAEHGFVIQTFFFPLKSAGGYGDFCVRYPLLILWFALASLAPVAQDQQSAEAREITPVQAKPRVLRGGGHTLGEPAEQFFSEGFAGEMQQACDKQDWKTVRQLARDGSKSKVKDVCASEKLAKQQAISGARLEFSGPGDAQTLRTDTFIVDGGHLVKIQMLYAGSSATLEGDHPKSFGELFAGLQEAYGPPTKSYTEPVSNVYGVKSQAHRAFWITEQDAITLIEQPGYKTGDEGSTQLIAETIAEYNRAAKTPKAANPLQ